VPVTGAGGAKRTASNLGIPLMQTLNGSEIRRYRQALLSAD